MSKVAAALFIGLGFLTGCKETPSQTVIPVTKDNLPAQTTEDVFMIDDPNNLIALNNLPRELPAGTKLQSKIEYFIVPVEPQPGVDYKIIASKPDSNVDYKILNPMQNTKRHLKELPKQQLQQQEQEVPGEIFMVP